MVKVHRLIVAGLALPLFALGCSSSGPEAGTGATPAVTEESITPSSSLPASRPRSDSGSTNSRGGGFVPLDNPEVIEATAATYLSPDDRVLGLTVNGESRAYPIRMLTYHHVANDEIGGVPVLVTF